MKGAVVCLFRHEAVKKSIFLNDIQFFLVPQGGWRVVCLFMIFRNTENSIACAKQKIFLISYKTEAYTFCTQPARMRGVTYSSAHADAKSRTRTPTRNHTTDLLFSKRPRIKLSGTKRRLSLPTWQIFVISGRSARPLKVAVKVRVAFVPLDAATLA